MEDIIKIKVDAGEAVTEIETVDESLKKVDETATETEEAVKGLKQRLREATRELLAMSESDPKRQQLIQEIGEMKDQMADAAEQIKMNTGPAIEGMNNSFGIMTDQLMNLDFDGLGKSLQQVGANMTRLSWKDMKAGLMSMKNGIQAVGQALLANPILLAIGLIVAAIAAIAMNWKEFEKLFTGEGAVESSLKAQAVALENQAKTLETELKLAQLYNDELGKQYQLQREILQNKLDQAEVQRELAILQDDMDKAAESQKTADEARLALFYEEEKQRHTLTNAVIEANKYTSNMTQQERDKVAAAQKYNDMISVAQERLQRLAADPALSFSGLGQGFDIETLNGQIQDLEKARQKAQAEVDAKYNKERQAKIQAQIQERAAFERELRNSILQATSTTFDYEMAMLDQQYSDKLKAAKKNGADTELVERWYTEQVLIIQQKQYEEEKKKDEEKLARKKELAQKQVEFENQMLNDLEELQEANYQAGLSQQQKELEANRYQYQEMILELERQGQDATNLKEEQRKKEAEINKKYNDKELQDAQNLRDAKIDLASRGLSALSELIGSFNVKDEKRAKKQFQIMKGIQMASALIDTYKAITGALADTATIPYYMKVANAVIAGATGFAQVAKIAQTTYDNPSASGGGGGGGVNAGGGGGGMQAPPIDFSFLDQTGQPNTVETYVLAGNVANALEARQKIIDQSHL